MPLSVTRRADPDDDQGTRVVLVVHLRFRRTAVGAWLPLQLAASEVDACIASGGGSPPLFVGHLRPRWPVLTHVRGMTPVAVRVLPVVERAALPAPSHGTQRGTGNDSRQQTELTIATKPTWTFRPAASPRRRVARSWHQRRAASNRAWSAWSRGPSTTARRAVAHLDATLSALPKRPTPPTRGDVGQVGLPEPHEDAGLGGAEIPRQAGEGVPPVVDPRGVLDGVQDQVDHVRRVAQVVPFGDVQGDPQAVLSSDRPDRRHSEPDRLRERRSPLARLVGQERPPAAMAPHPVFRPTGIMGYRHLHLPSEQVRKWGGWGNGVGESLAYA